VAASVQPLRPAMPAAWETIGGVPLGLSRDYDHLPRTGPLRAVRCATCDQWYEDVERLLEDGCCVLAIMCVACRERGRARWIADARIELPRAVAMFRKETR
jgi:hypothetical protein